MTKAVQFEKSTGSFVLLTSTILAVALVIGCGRSKKEEPAETSGAAVPGETRKAVTEKQPVSQSQLPVADMPTEAPGSSDGGVLPSPFRVGAVIDQGNGTILVGLISDDTGFHDMVEVGDTFEGHVVVEIDSVGSQVYLERGGQRYVARLSAGSGIVSAPAGEIIAPQPVASSPSAMVDSEVRYTPTADETARGIDPNNADTWPPGYRGPGIERAGFKEVLYEQTADEKARGIDPNNSDTWPAGYRGPGIERAMMESSK